MKINQEVAKALMEGKPVVALESTIISHGMPYPKNVETANLVEETIRKNGAIPATIGIIDGEIIVGLSHSEIEEFGKRKGVVKVSRRDLPLVVSKKLWGATTVAASIIIASKAGIKTFVTGGIGGVHRGATETMDISADLQELAHTSILVVCAGPKAILDIPLTLEYLETMGVPVLGYQVNKLPCFYSRSSKYAVDYEVDTPKEVAAVMQAKWDLGLTGSILLANPIPEKYSMDNAEIEKVIQAGILEMNSKKIKGKEATPFLLSYVKEKTHGESLEANIALVVNNAIVGAKIAVAYSQLKK
ncbi:MAG: pseudouridine-5'-phosphate glycosidase [Bacilli bacterium]|nr:pseudouridine-5'-phosphate glycosidase [Bacilli bacterium]